MGTGCEANTNYKEKIIYGHKKDETKLKAKTTWLITNMSQYNANRAIQWEDTEILKWLQKIMVSEDTIYTSI